MKRNSKAANTTACKIISTPKIRRPSPTLWTPSLLQQPLVAKQMKWKCVHWMQNSLNLLNCSADTVKRDHKIYANINKLMWKWKKKSQTRNENCALSIIVCVCVYGCVRKLCECERMCACQCMWMCAEQATQKEGTMAARPRRQQQQQPPLSQSPHFADVPAPQLE